MFDVSFTELLVIGVVALVVIGPERLPKVARTLGHLVGRAQRYVNDVKTDIQREVELDELRKLKDQMQDAAQSVQSSLQNTEASLRKPLESLEQDVSALKESLTHTSSDLVEPVAPEIPKAPAATTTNATSSDLLSTTAPATPSFAEAEVQAMLVPNPLSSATPSPEPLAIPLPEVTAVPVHAQAPVVAAPTQLELGALAPAPTAAPALAPASASTAAPALAAAHAPNKTSVASSTPGSAS
jgi:sec-independent protein translocase protein TatB